MFKRILALIRAPWICSIVTKTVTGLSAAIVVLNYVKEQIGGSEVGDKIVPTIEKVTELVNSILAALTKVGNVLCGSMPVQVSIASVDDAVNVIDRISTELRNS